MSGGDTCAVSHATVGGGLVNRNGSELEYAAPAGTAFCPIDGSAVTVCVVALSIWL